MEMVTDLVDWPTFKAGLLDGSGTPDDYGSLNSPVCSCVSITLPATFVNADQSIV